MSSVGCGHCLCQVLGQQFVTNVSMQCEPGSRACWQIIKIFWPLPPPPADKTACTQQPCLRPGCCLHAISFSDVVLTPLATSGHYSGLYSSDQGRLHHLMGSWSWPPLQPLIAPMSLAWAHYMSMNMNEWDKKCEWMGQRMQMNGTGNMNERGRECKWRGQRTWMNGP